MSEKHANHRLILECEQQVTLSVLSSFIFDEQTSADQMRQIQTRLRRIDGALKRLDGGVFGVCQICGVEIQAERLVTLPYAELCIGCQRRQEKGSDFDKQ